MEVVCDVMVYFIWFEGCVHRLPCGQATFRAMKGRRRYQRALDRRFLIDQEERRLGAKKRKCVRMIEGAWMVRGWAPPPPPATLWLAWAMLGDPVCIRQK